MGKNKINVDKCGGGKILIEGIILIMKYCKNCGSELPDDTQVCPNCGARLAEPVQETMNVSAANTNVPSTPTETDIWGTLALLFGIFGFLGIIFGPIGMSYYKNTTGPNHKRNVKYCQVGLGLSAFWFVLWLIILISISTQA
mgnify:CR=1 FL=1